MGRRERGFVLLMRTKNLNPDSARGRKRGEEGNEERMKERKRERGTSFTLHPAHAQD
jgi:hypothetical protein